MGGELGQGVFALSIAKNIYCLETALVTQPNEVPEKSIPGTSEFTLSTIWSCSDLLADKWIMQVGIKP